MTMRSATLTEDLNVGRQYPRARDVSTASVVNAIRRGSVKISWPIPVVDDDHAMLAAQPPGPLAAATPTTARAPVRPPRDDGVAATTTNASAMERGVEIQHVSSRERLRQMPMPALREDASSQLPRPGEVTKGPPSNRPKRRGDSVRWVIRRLLRRSGGKDGLRSTPSRQSGGISSRAGHHRSDPGGIALMTSGERSERTQRSISLPIEDMSGLDPFGARTRETPADTLAATPAVGPGEEAYRTGLNVEAGSSKPWQAMSPEAQFEDDPDRPWQAVPPHMGWTGQNDMALSGAWTGLAPRPASSYARRAGSFSPTMKSDDIGVAVAFGPNSSRRRSRSAGELKTLYRLPRSQPERRMSEEIRYWRESVSAQPLSPLSNDKAPGELAQSSRPISYDHAAFDPEPQSPPGERLSTESEALKDAEVVDLRRRVAELEAKVWHLQTAMAKIHRYLTEKHEGDPAVPDVLKHTLSRGSGETFSLTPKKMGFHTRRGPSLAPAPLPGLSAGVGLGTSPAVSLDRISMSSPSISRMSDADPAPGGLSIAHPPRSHDLPGISVERQLSLSTITTTATAATTTTTATNTARGGMVAERPQTVFLDPRVGASSRMGKGPLTGGVDPAGQDIGVSEPAEGSLAFTNTSSSPQWTGGKTRRPWAATAKGKAMHGRTQPGSDDKTQAADNGGDDDDDDDDNHDEHDHDAEDEAYTTTSETFITPTEDKTFAGSSSSLSSFGGDQEGGSWSTNAPSADQSISTAAAAEVSSPAVPIVAAGDGGGGGQNSPSQSARSVPSPKRHQDDLKVSSSTAAAAVAAASPVRTAPHTTTLPPLSALLQSGPTTTTTTTSF